MDNLGIQLIVYYTAIALIVFVPFAFVVRFLLFSIRFVFTEFSEAIEVGLAIPLVEMQNCYLDCLRNGTGPVDPLYSRRDEGQA